TIRFFMCRNLANRRPSFHRDRKTLPAIEARRCASWPYNYRDSEDLYPPLSLYVHVPWCIRKCPYCDFNSHETANLPALIDPYLDALLLDWAEELERLTRFGGPRSLQSIFIGGGTPSLLP